MTASRIFIKLLPVLVPVTLFLIFASPRGRAKHDINIHFTLNHQADSWQNNRTGLLWTLSYLGAGLPKGSLENSLTWLDSATFNLTLSRLGFSENALTAISQLADSLRNTDAYIKTGSVDLGHFIAITLGSSWHYYKITGAPPTLRDFSKLHGKSAFKNFALTNSCVSKHARVIRCGSGESILNTCFIAEEGTGGGSPPREYEAFDIMPNGQLRFMIYDENGNLTAAADSSVGTAGKPAKCVWCHELNIQQAFYSSDSISGYMDFKTFREMVASQNALLNEYRVTLNSEIDFGKKQDHTYQEIIYISYMEPSIKRLSQEWKLPENDLRKLLSLKKTHTHHEFPYLGELYSRHEIGDSAAISHGACPGNIREPNNCEPDFFRSLKRKS